LADRAEARAQQRQQQILGQQEPAQPGHAGAQRRAYHQLLFPAHPPHEGQVGDVGGRDDHHEGRGAHEEPEGEPGPFPQRFLEGNYRDPVVGS